MCVCVCVCVYPEDQRSSKPTAVPHPETLNSSPYLFQDKFYHFFLFMPKFSKPFFT